MKEELEKLRHAFREASDKQKAEMDKLVEECDHYTKLAVAAWVIRNIVDHAKEGGSFRTLIYERLEFGPEAYMPLYEAGGMTISNEFKLNDGE